MDTIPKPRHLKYSTISKIITHNLFGNNNVCEFSTYSNNSFLHDVLCLRHTPYFSRLPSLKVLVKKIRIQYFWKSFWKWILEKYGNLPKENKLKGYGHFNICFPVLRTNRWAGGQVDLQSRDYQNFLDG